MSVSSPTHGVRRSEYVLTKKGRCLEVGVVWAFFEENVGIFFVEKYKLRKAFFDGKSLSCWSM